MTDLKQATKPPGKPAPPLPPDQLSINEIYFTVQGECKWIGTPTAFVRTSHCPLRCVWCFGPRTRVLMGDWSWKEIQHVRIGDVVMGRSETTRRLVRTLVQATSTARRETVLVNGHLVTTPDHRFLERTLWRRVDRLVGRQAKFLAPPRPITSADDYRRGYLAGMADGDGCFWSLRTKGKRPYRRFRLALNDGWLLDEFQRLALEAGFFLYPGQHGHSRTYKGQESPYVQMSALWLTTDAEAERFEAWLDEDVNTEPWHLGYLAGVFDAEGSFSHTDGQGDHLMIAQKEEANPEVRARLQRSLDALQLEYTKNPRGFLVRSRRGGHYRFVSWCRPKRTERTDLLLRRRLVNWELIRSVEPTGRVETVYDISTEARSFVAEGFVVHNCDSQYTFNEGRPLTLPQILAEVAKFPTKHVCLTGGEPLAQSASFDLCEDLAERGYTVEIETSGSEDISPLNRMAPAVRERLTVNLDIKCPGSAMSKLNRRENWDLLHPHDQVKFVLVDRADYEWARDVVRSRKWPCDVWFHPAWKRLEPAQLVEWVKADGLTVRVGIQAHKYIWGDVRGV